MSRRKAIRPMIVITKGSNSFHPSHLGNEVKHLDNELKTKKESPNRDEEVEGGGGDLKDLEDSMLLQVCRGYYG
jgi:hypothetical protein